jgi:hypothetical protein
MIKKAIDLLAFNKDKSYILGILLKRVLVHAQNNESDILGKVSQEFKLSAHELQ